MPRKVHSTLDPKPPRHHDLVAALVDELKSSKDYGQPLIEEEAFKTGSIRVNVFWDRWDELSDEERSMTIIDAYRSALGVGYADRIALVNGLTFPEAHASGMLPFQVIAALRRDDPVTADQCRQAMIDQGASMLFAPDRPQLRFATQDEAESCRKRLADTLPGSEQIWQVLQEVGQNLGLSWDTMD